MILSQSEKSLTVRCPAKVNLFLELHGQRPDGYHEIETVMQAVTLHDELVLRRTPGKDIAFRCSDLALPSGPGNLAYRAAERVLEACGSTGVDITLEKAIPYGAGLGGGSSDAAGVLVGLDRLLGLHLGRERLIELAAALGSDVPFFIEAGTALCMGRGERVQPVPAAFTAHYVIVYPPCVLPTRDVYEKARRMGLTSGNHSASLIVRFLADGDANSTGANLFNRLDAVAEAISPDVANAKRCLSGASEVCALVSGSGSAVFALLESEARAAEVANRMRNLGAGRVFVARTEQAAGNGPVSGA